MTCKDCYNKPICKWNIFINKRKAEKTCAYFRLPKEKNNTNTIDKKNSLWYNEYRKGKYKWNVKVVYWWQDEDEDFPQCHCPEDIPVAPCEYDDIVEEDK